MHYIQETQEKKKFEDRLEELGEKHSKEIQKLGKE
jgi:hypothetical protein